MPNRSQFNTHEEYLNWYRNYRRVNRKKLRLYVRKYNRIWRKIFGYHNEKKWIRNNPEKVRASSLLRRAIKKGYVKRQPCVVCGNPKSHGHHEDYSKPLEVIWLCSLHHKHRHLEMKLENSLNKPLFNPTE